jgi:hypothetical protein
MCAIEQMARRIRGKFHWSKLRIEHPKTFRNGGVLAQTLWRQLNVVSTRDYRMALAARIQVVLPTNGLLQCGREQDSPIGMKEGVKEEEAKAGQKERPRDETVPAIKSKAQRSLASLCRILHAELEA